MSTESAPATAPAKAQCSKATLILLSVAATMPVMARKMGLELQDDGRTLVYVKGVSRPWLKPHPTRVPSVLQFDPDVFARNLGVWSSSEVYCALFLLNLWNPVYARGQGWHFDLFKGYYGEDSDAIAEWLKNPIWP